MAAPAQVFSAVFGETCWIDAAARQELCQPAGNAQKGFNLHDDIAFPEQGEAEIPVFQLQVIAATADIVVKSDAQPLAAIVKERLPVVGQVYLWKRLPALLQVGDFPGHLGI